MKFGDYVTITVPRERRKDMRHLGGMRGQIQFVWDGNAIVLVFSPLDKGRATSPVLPLEWLS